jgi:hypothetical protein
MTLKTNPKFDPRIYNVHGLVGSKKGSGLTRGRIVQAKNQPERQPVRLQLPVQPDGGAGAAQHRHEHRDPDPGS